MQQRAARTAGHTRSRSDSIPLNGAALKAIRTAARVSRQALAAEIQVSVSYLCHLENGTKGKVSMDVLRAIEDALRIKDRRALVAVPADDRPEVKAS